jgi:hypothetical protein
LQTIVSQRPFTSGSNGSQVPKTENPADISGADLPPGEGTPPVKEEPVRTSGPTTGERSVINGTRTITVPATEKPLP